MLLTFSETETFGMSVAELCRFQQMRIQMICQGLQLNFLLAQLFILAVWKAM